MSQDKQFNLNITSVKMRSLLSERVSAKPIEPELIEHKKLANPLAYKRFCDLPQKEQFRAKLVQQLNDQWANVFGEEVASVLCEQFKQLTNDLDKNGAIIFAELINKIKFQELITEYNKILNQTGSKSWIHSYVNLGNHPEFLTNKLFNQAFLHPLLIALISYRVGGPIRIVDARGKDAEPISVQAQDNMLHIDNTPFNDEYKIILTWERNKPSGPKGQNFVFIPGTQKGARNSFIDSTGKAWSSENASIFITDQAIQQVFDFQQKILNTSQPVVVEASHPDKPLTTVFAAGSLVHHRYRTEEGSSRSCMILAFHRAIDNPGQFIAPNHLQNISKTDDLTSFLFGYHGANTEDKFVSALTTNAAEIASILTELNNCKTGVEIVQPQQKTLSALELNKWKSIATSAPTVEELKIKERFMPLGKTIKTEDFPALVHRMMMFDKHGPMDLILYSDSHEEIRKWARNRIREMKSEKLKKHLEAWVSTITQPAPEQLLLPAELNKIAGKLVDKIDSLPEEQKKSAKLDSVEKISPIDAYRSLRQLIIDLGEAILRCESRQNFLTTGLFLFWACDELITLVGEVNKELISEVKSIGTQLLANYLSTAILIEKQIQQEQQLQRDEKSIGIMCSTGMSLHNNPAVKSNAKCLFYHPHQKEAERVAVRGI